MSTHHEHTPVVIIGAGVAGLTVGNLLLRSGIGCIILERRTRAYVESRQRAGTIDTRGVRMFREWGLSEVVEGDQISQGEGGFWIDEVALPLDLDDESEAVYCPQQILVRNLTDVFLRGGGDLRYEAEEIALTGLDGPTAHVTYRRHGQAVDVEAQLVAGCDGDHGVSRASIPDGVLTRYAREYAYAWLSVLAEVPTRPSGMAIHDRGLAGMIPRGPQASRLYLQIPTTDTAPDWSPERIWDELQARFGPDTPVDRGPIVSSVVVPLRSVVFEPMRHGTLFLLGDAAHIVPPMSAKGINLALHDAETFVRGVVAQIDDADPTVLERYSDDALRHVWNYQAFAVWITDTMHEAGDASYAGAFAKQVARAELQRQFTSPAATALFAELTSGTN